MNAPTSPSPEEIKAFRSAVGGISQAVLADQLGVSRRAVEEWEAGRREPPAMLRLAMAALNARLAPWHPMKSLVDLPQLYAERRQLLAEMAEQDAETTPAQVLDWRARLQALDEQISHVQRVVGL